MTKVFDLQPGGLKDGGQATLNEEESKKITIAPAYNKGGYQVISNTNLKDIGK